MNTSIAGTSLERYYCRNCWSWIKVEQESWAMSEEATLLCRWWWRIRRESLIVENVTGLNFESGQGYPVYSTCIIGYSPLLEPFVPSYQDHSPGPLCFLSYRTHLHTLNL